MLAPFASAAILPRLRLPHVFVFLLVFMFVFMFMFMFLLVFVLLFVLVLLLLVLGWKRRPWHSRRERPDAA